MTTNTTNSQAPEILAKQVAEWRKEVVRLNDLIAHAGGRNSQAASIDTPEFRQRLRSLRNYTIQEAMDTELNEICDDIDAKLAQAYQQGRIDALRMLTPQGQADTSGLPG